MHNTYEDDYTSEDDQPQGLRRIIAVYMKWGGAVVSIALISLFVLWSYRLGVRDAAEIPVIRALDGPVRVQPESPGGAVAANQGLEVNEILAGEEAQIPQDAQLAPATLTLTEEDTPAEPSPPTLSPEEGIDTAALSESEDPDLPDVIPTDEDAAVLDPQDEPEILEPDGPPQEVDIGALVASVLEEDAGESDPTEEVEETAALTTNSTRPRLRVNAGPFRAPTQSEDGGPIAPGTLLIQLGAFDSREIAATQWAALLVNHEDLLGTRRQVIQQVNQNGRVFFRLRVLGFDSSGDQSSLCEALGARDVECIPVTAR